MSSQQAADGLLAAQSLETLNQTFEPIARRFGFDCYAVGRVVQPGAPGEFFLMMWPTLWLERYAANGFVHSDPVVAEAQLARDAFTWSDVKQRRPGQGAQIFDAALEFGWSDGLVVPVHGPGHERGLVAMAATRLTLTSEARRDFVGLALLTYRCARELALHRSPIRPRLTPREREALSHVARGFEDREIADAMSVSVATARNHVQKARERLCASTRAQAVAMAMVSRLI